MMLADMVRSWMKVYDNEAVDYAQDVLPRISRLRNGTALRVHRLRPTGRRLWATARTSDVGLHR